ncbi:glycosyl hydrolase 115 family protein [Ferruginibacter sp. SUN106]|uniref:glycosyl hydrolase 115 family protein n=1 Tax=Ferruginibacter sp. SUN106 TaxID=2978348 RepID=UPI003D36307A
MLQRFTVSISFVLLLLFNVQSLPAQTKNSVVISEQNSAVAFPLFTNTVTPVFYYDAKDAKVVQLAATAFANDISLLSGKQIKLNSSNTVTDEYAIIAGTIGQSSLIDDLIKTKRIDVAAIQNKWEQFSITVINQPYKNAKRILAITGSDRRATAFGIFHLSRTMGISPFVWWADVVPEKKNQLFVSGNYMSPAPSVQYRGIFINDEDWGMQPWAAKNMDTDIKDIGPKTYARVFELLLRLKANYIWPAMHPCTKAFYYYKQNPKVADDYAIVVGGSHCEPMLRNNVCEWAETYEEEYKKKPGEWRYDVNKDEIYKYWDDRIKEAVNYESVFTVGMRGVHDGSMPGPKDPDEKVKLLEKVIADQREILQNNFKKSPDALPQIFVPYKEVLSLYRRGMKLPEDVTIIWPDDNYGYMRQLPNEEEQKRSGGNGVYYHLSYWGSPADYLWLSSMSPALIGYEMKKSYDYGAKKLWVFNVGDIKPAEMEIQFAMDMGYDINTYNAKDPDAYIKKWAVETFGEKNAPTVAAIKKRYYQLAASAKPEHLGMLSFSTKEIYDRLKEYEDLGFMVDTFVSNIKTGLQPALFELVTYPAEAARMLNYKILYERLAAIAFNENRIEEAKSNLQTASIAYQSIETSTERYNRFVAGGKWNGMMSFHPRDQKVFNAPLVFDSLKIKTDSLLIKKQIKEAQRVKILTAKELYDNKNTMNCSLLPGVGISGAALTGNAGMITYKMPMTSGSYTIVIKCLPTFAMEKERLLNYTIAVNNETPQTVNVNAEAESAAWKENVLRGYSQGSSVHAIAKDTPGTISIVLKNKNLVISQVEIYKN